MSDLFPPPIDAEADFISDRQKLAAVRREIAMRRSLYPKRVETGKMNASTATAEIAVMEAIAADYMRRINSAH